MKRVALMSMAWLLIPIITWMPPKPPVFASNGHPVVISQTGTATV